MKNLNTNYAKRPSVHDVLARKVVHDVLALNTYELIVKLTAPAKEVNLHVLAIGINKYKNPALNLNYAQPDAKGISNFFRQKGKGLFKKVEIVEIYNEQATKENISAKLKQLQNTHPQDVVLIYLAGHGEGLNYKWYFIPHELTFPERENDVILLRHIYLHRYEGCDMQPSWKKKLYFSG